MISLQVDEAYAFDYLAILHTKILKLNSAKSSELFNQVYDSIEKQVGAKTAKDIINSNEYKNLLKANIDVFDAVEKARKEEPIDGRIMDNLNQKRFEAKKVIQVKFFSSDLQEIKS